jgi:hypothetical protein
MKLTLDTVDLEGRTITFKIPSETWETLAFASCEIEVDISLLEEFGQLRQRGESPWTKARGTR